MNDLKKRQKAYSLVAFAKVTGKLIQRPCYLCGNEKSEAHHPDYDKPLEVVWVCRKHHRLIDSSREMESILKPKKIIKPPIPKIIL